MFRSLFGSDRTVPRIETKDATGKALRRVLTSSTGSVVTEAPLTITGNWDFDKAVAHGLEKVVWVFRCVDAIAQNQARIKILIRRGYDRREGTIIQDEVLNRILNYQSNSKPEMAWYLRYKLSSHLMLSRRGAFVGWDYSPDGRISEIFLLPPNRVHPVPSVKDYVKEYEVIDGENRTVHIPKDRILWLRLKPHPSDDYAQMTPLMSAGVNIETDFLVGLFNRIFIQNDSRPGLLVAVNPTDPDEGVPQQDIDYLNSKFNGGYMMAGSTTVIEAAGVEVQDMSITPRDIQWQELGDVSKEKILMAFGTPETVMGNAAGRTFDNADAERENWWLDTMVPHCDAIASGLDPLTDQVADDAVIAYNYDEVDVLQRASQRRKEDMRDRFRQGVATLDMVIEAEGGKPLNIPSSRVYYLPNGVVSGEPSDVKEVVAMQLLGRPADPTQQQGQQGGGGTDYAALMRQAVQDAGRQAVAAVGNQTAAERVRGLPRYRTAALNSALYEAKNLYPDSGDEPSRDGDIVVKAEVAHPYETVRYEVAGLFEGVLTALDSVQEEVFVSRLGHVKFRKGTFYDSEELPEFKAVNANYVVDITKWEMEVRDSLDKVLRNVMIREFNKAAREYIAAGGDTRSKTGTFVTKVFGNQGVGDSVLDDVFESVFSTVVEPAIRRQSNRVIKHVQDSADSNTPLPELEKSLRSLMGTRVAWRKSLSVAATTTLIESIRHAVYESNSQRGWMKTWNSVGDERVRPAHEKLDGKTVPLDSVFVSGADVLRYPGDVMAPASQTVNCRCWISYRRGA